MVDIVWWGVRERVGGEKKEKKRKKMLAHPEMHMK